MTFADVNQILLFIVVLALSIVLTIAGIEVIRLLKELRRAVTQTVDILDDVEDITSSVSKPMVSLSGFLTGLKSGTDFINLILHKKSSKNGR